MRAIRNSFSARESATAGSVAPIVVASATMRSHRFGVRTMRRMEETWPSVRATTSFDAIMKSSMSSVARFLSCFSTLVISPRLMTGRVSIVSMLSAPWR